jgi:uncharacterized membrane protein
MAAGNINGNSTTGSAVMTPLRQHRSISANPKQQQPVLSRQSAAATTIYGDRDDSRRTAASVKLWLIRGVVQVSASCFWYRTHLITYLLTYLLTYSLTYLLTYLLNYSLTSLITYLLNYLLTYLLTHLLTYSLTYLITYLPLTYLLTYFFTYLFPYLLTP